MALQKKLLIAVVTVVQVVADAAIGDGKVQLFLKTILELMQQLSGDFSFSAVML